LKELLKEARSAAKIACTKRGQACTDANKRVDGLVGKWTAAGSTLVSAPVVAGEGDVARISAWTLGYVSQHQGQLYLPLLWPVTIALVSAFFWGVWGAGRRKMSPVVELKACEPTQSTTPQPQTVQQPQQENVVDVLIEVVQPADRRKRVELEDI